jgi:hypothetical protein
VTKSLIRASIAVIAGLIVWAISATADLAWRKAKGADREKPIDRMSDIVA